MPAVMNRCPSCGHSAPEPFPECPVCAFDPPSIDGVLAFAPELARSNEHFRSEHFEKLYRVEDAHWWFQARNRLICWMIRRYFPSFRSVLEIGCGTGVVADALQRAFPLVAISGTEIYSEGLQFARGRLPSATFFQSDARRLPVTSLFDVVGAFDVLEHIDEDELVLAQMYDAARPGGGLLITVPQHDWLWSSADDRAQHVRRYSVADLTRKIRGAGFEILRVTSFVSLLLPLMAASRIGGDNHACAEMGEFRISAQLNGALAAVSEVERRLIASGVNFPAGGSLIVAARRPQGHG